MMFDDVTPHAELNAITRAPVVAPVPILGSYDRCMTDEAGGHVPVTRRQWDERMSAWFERYARTRWAAAEPFWGIWCIPQSTLPVMPADVAGAVAVELGCGSGYVSAWLARRGACPVGVDVSARQLAVARRLQDDFDLRFPLIQADAERVPLGAACADLVISEYGASTWCDPYRWIPEAARLLRPGGQLVFMAQSTLAHLCMPEHGPATNRLVRDLSGLHRVVRRGTSGTEYRLFALPHGEWIRLMTRHGLMLEDLIEVEVPPGATNKDFPEYPDEWVRHWPAEEVWFARRRSARTRSGRSVLPVIGGSGGECAPIGAGRGSEVSAEVEPEVVGAAQAAAPGYLLDGERAVLEQFAGCLPAGRRNVRWRTEQPTAATTPGAAKGGPVHLVGPLGLIEGAGMDDRRAGRWLEHRDFGPVQVAADVADSDRSDLIRLNEPQVVRLERLEAAGGCFVAPAQFALNPPVRPGTAAHPHRDSLEDVFLGHFQDVLQDPELLAVPGQHRYTQGDPLIRNREFVVRVHAAYSLSQCP
jgi:SAM-dependent methyltransferase